MIKNQNVICISSIDWDFVWQGHQEIMSTFAKNGNRVLFIENTGIRRPTFKDIGRLKKRFINWVRSVKGFRKEEENLFIYSPVILPFPYSRLASWINRRLLIEPLKKWMKAVSFHEPIIWTFLPTSIALDIINECNDRKLLIYYDIADFSALTDNLDRLKKTEIEVIKKCDLIFAQGKAIADKCRGLNSNVHIFQFGVNAEVFEDFKNVSGKTSPQDLKDIKKPIIGYVGGIHKHVDIALLRYMARTHAEWSIVLVGPAQTDISELSVMPNIFTLGKKEFEKLPAYIDQFDVCTIPYVISDYTKTVYPTKLNEYHIMGKPVVSTALPEVIAVNAGDSMTAIANTHEEFVMLVEKAIAADNSKGSFNRIEAAKKNSWAERIDEMSVLIESAIERKKMEASPGWQERLLFMYKNTKRNTLKMAGFFLALYFLIFYTPLVWVFAQPLVITDRPQKADAIVVLGGGVGESGKVGQGYEERVKYAVDLYNDGYAKRVIFLSGYTHIFKETLVMKALAISLGIPENAIIIDNKACNTYEDVKFVKEISRDKNWKDILLLSSPYHMLRVSKTFQKIAGDLRVVYTPMPLSSFYVHGNEGFFQRKINLQQIRGIIHEYIGIIYYWLKGWA